MIQIIVNFVFVFVLFFTGQLDFDLTNMANILDIPSLRYASPFRKLAGATVEWIINCSKVDMIFKLN